MIKIIITGPESSGKTTLSRNLSHSLKGGLVNEYARKYINQNNNQYIYEDLLKIAKTQYQNEESIKDNKLCFCDTDLITIKIWSEFKYNKCASWITNKIIQQKNEKRIYLLCKPDINWEYDSQRENESNRDEIFDIYLKELKKLNHLFFVVKGSKRLEKSLEFLDKEVL